jgi:hypothetical protein
MKAPRWLQHDDVGTGAVKAVLFRAERDKTEWLSRAVMRIR